MVMAASKERKKQEQKLVKGSHLKSKLSQTGWKIRNNFLQQGAGIVDEKDRIDLFDIAEGCSQNLDRFADDGQQPAYANQYNQHNGPQIKVRPYRKHDDNDSSSDGDCMILDYGLSS